MKSVRFNIIYHVRNKIRYQIFSMSCFVLYQKVGAILFRDSGNIYRPMCEELE